MLQELKITNLALIEELRVGFRDGLTVMTGETGAGKSIILQAIHLLGGGRASAAWVRTGARNATVEGLFEISPGRTSILDRLAERGFESDGEIVIKRVLSDQGRSRFYLNGDLATARIISEIVENLLSVASQHDHQQLLAPRYHLDFIDLVGGLWEQRREVAVLHDQWAGLRSRRDGLREQEADKERRRDFLAFQCREIEEANLVPGEDDALAVTRDRLRSSEDLNQLGRKSYRLLADGITGSLAQVRKNLEQMASFDPTLAGMAEEVAGYSYQLEDQMIGLRQYLEAIPNDPAELDRVTERLAVINQLKRKYGNDLGEVLAYAEKARRELGELRDLDDRLAELEQELARCERKLGDKASALSVARRAKAAQLAATISKELAGLCFDQAGFEIVFADGPEQPSDLGALTRLGWDRPEFMFSANPGEPVRPLARVASGGELSRLMLALKCLLARRDQVETVIFDEVDAGISGKTADAVARKIRELAGHHQVLCITHLPQIAACADDHFRVDKSVSGERTRTSITRLAPADRPGELARMLDGDAPTPRTLAYARELIARKQE